MRKLLLLCPALLAGCATNTASSPYPLHSGQERFVCRPTGLPQFVGQPASQEVGLNMLRASGAKTMRWVAPGQMVTMDFREDRLTVHTNESNRIASANCG